MLAKGRSSTARARAIARRQRLGSVEPSIWGADCRGMRGVENSARRFIRPHGPHRGWNWNSLCFLAVAGEPLLPFRRSQGPDASVKARGVTGVPSPITRVWANGSAGDVVFVQVAGWRNSRLRLPRKSFPGVRLAVKDRQQYTAEPENRQSIWDEVRDDPALSGWRRSWTATIS